MSLIEEIRLKVQNDDFEFAKHAVDQSIIRQISIHEVREAILGKSEIIEDYPEDKYGPSCLILGKTKGNRALHIHCSYPSRPLIKVITVYEPTPTQWIDSKKRRKKWTTNMNN